MASGLTAVELAYRFCPSLTEWCGFRVGRLAFGFTGGLLLGQFGCGQAAGGSGRNCTGKPVCHVGNGSVHCGSVGQNRPSVRGIFLNGALLAAFLVSGWPPFGSYVMLVIPETVPWPRAGAVDLP